MENKNKKRKPPIDLDSMVYGKVPPQAKDIEGAILGAIMIDKGAFDTVIGILQPECFYLESHANIFKACVSLTNKQEPIDIHTVVEQLRREENLEKVGGAYFVTRLTNDVISGVNIATHSKIVYQKYVQREIIKISGELINEAYEDSADAFDMLDLAETRFSNLSIRSVIKPYSSLQSLAEKAIKKIYELKNSESDITGVPSGIRKLDLITQGFQPTDLIVVAARPAVGKSAVAANIGMNAATTGIPVGIFSLEMGATQWIMRMLSGESQIGLWDLKRGKVTDQEMQKLSDIAFKKWVTTNIFFDDTASMDIYQLKSKARIMVHKEKVGIIIVDYMQLISGNRSSNENREQEVSKISRELKQLAKELNIPIIALSQLSRAGDSHNPKLSNLRESGAIEQDADCVFFLIDPSDTDVKDDASLKDSILIKIAKNRNGIEEDVAVKFIKHIQKIMNEEDYEKYQTKKRLGPGAWQPVNIPFE